MILVNGHIDVDGILSIIDNLSNKRNEPIPPIVYDEPVNINQCSLFFFLI
jgi:hypothetical protein